MIAEHETPCHELISNRGRIKSLEDRAERQEKTNDAIFKALDEIRDNLLGRPSWFVTVIIGLLSSCCAFLLGIILKLMGY